MTEREEYEQYLRETGQKAPPAEEAPGFWSRESWDKSAEKMKQLYSDPNAVQQSLENSVGMMSGGLSKAIPAIGRGVGKLFAPAIEGALVGAASTPEDRLRGFLTGGTVQGGVSGAGKVLGKVGDIAMQMGVGRNKYTPGVGTELANQGLIGTKNMLKSQAGEAANRVGSEMQQVASEIPFINAENIGNQMREELTGPLTGGGSIKPSARDLGEIAQYKAFADDIAQRGIESGSDALSRRVASGKSAYSAKTQEPKLAPIAKSSKLEQQLYSGALKEADPRMIPLDASYAALAKAKHALQGEAPLSGGGVLFGSAGKYGGSLPLTTAGQIGTKADKLAEFLAPATRQATISGMRASEPSAEELAEYAQYLKETGQRR